MFMTEKMPENNNVEQSEWREEELKVFRAEVQGLQESQRTGEHISEDLTQTATKDLTERDMEMWRTIQGWRKNPLSSEEMRELLDDYSKAFFDENGSLRGDVPRSRYAFCQFARNKAGEVIVPKQMEELRKG
ncbi:MAG: hypothetical protein Q7J22_01045 [Candidatus Wolfebacteria bacterium]|nr:hypothetical protein [Candidatus Wolfebacteria bacterium]